MRSGLKTWGRRQIRFLSLTLGIFCFIEVFMHLTDGTNPNVTFPWGHYPETIAAIGAVMLLIGYATRRRTA